MTNRSKKRSHIHQLFSHFWRSIQLCHNERDSVSNHRRLDCLLDRLFRRRTKKTSKLRVTGLCEGNQSVTRGFTSQRDSNAKLFSFGDIITCTAYSISLWHSFCFSLVLCDSLIYIAIFFWVALLAFLSWENTDDICHIYTIYIYILQNIERKR